MSQPFGFSEEVHAAALQLLRAPISTQPILSSWNHLLDYLHASLAHSPIEKFHVLYLDRRNRLIVDQTLGVGTIDHVPVYPREVCRHAILNNASAVIIAHNHPSGDPAPSPEDKIMTKKLHKALQTLDITLHDHVIIGHGGQYSFRAHGDL